MWFDGTLLERLDAWHRRGSRVVLATIVSIAGSAPRPLGSAIAIADSGEVYGAVSNGCVEAEIVAEAQSVLRDGIVKMLTYGVGDGVAQSGLLCGGEITVLLERLSPTFADDLRAATERVGALFVVTSSEGKRLQADSPDALGDADVRFDAATMMLYQRFAPPPQLVLLGAGDITEALAVLGRFLGFIVTLVDPRVDYTAKYADPSHYDAIVHAWPETVIADLALTADTALVSFFHEQRFELAALAHALTHTAAYVGALGSRRVQRERAGALRDRGVPAEQLERLHAPVGLDIGANTPKEIALAIMAEIVAVRGERDGTSLKHGDGPIMSAHANPTACPNR